MENKINIAKLLKDCPEGTKLYSPICGECTFDSVMDVWINVYKENLKRHFTFNHLGQHCSSSNDSECLLFPSKDNRDWSKFQRQFKDGDILSYQCKCFKNRTIFIYMYHSRMNTTYYVALSGSDDSEFMINDKEGHALNGFNDSVCFATEEEKQKLFKAIKNNGYKWNAEAKTLEKLVEPRFKVGNRVKSIYNNTQYDIKELTDTHYTLVEVVNKFQFMEPIIEDKNWELVELVPKFKVGDKIRKKGEYSTYTITDVKYEHYCCGKYVICNIHEDDWELVPDKFDITTLIPFESKVLVRDADHEWEGAVFGRYNGDSFFTIGGLNWGQCIPYEGNEHLFGKTDDCDEFYKTW